MPVRTKCFPAPAEYSPSFDAYKVDTADERNRPMANISTPDGSAMAHKCSVIADADQDSVHLRPHGCSRMPHVWGVAISLRLGEGPLIRTHRDAHKSRYATIGLIRK